MSELEMRWIRNEYTVPASSGRCSSTSSTLLFHRFCYVPLCFLLISTFVFVYQCCQWGHYKSGNHTLWFWKFPEESGLEGAKTFLELLRGDSVTQELSLHSKFLIEIIIEFRWIRKRQRQTFYKSTKNLCHELNLTFLLSGNRMVLK